MARLLHDGRGRFVYVGDSANFSFLQALRQIAADAVGDCDFTSDASRSLFIEQPASRVLIGSMPDGSTSIADSEIALGLDQAELLINQYLVATACILDLFEVTVLFKSLRSWKAEQTMAPGMSVCLINLVLAIGAQVTTGDGWDDVGEQHFERGRQQALQSYTDEPSLQTVQAFTLITMYLLSGARRNAAFMNLGIAIRAAYTLGLHRRDIRAMFPQAERQLRERIWQSLRVIDLFLSTTLGRPPATAGVDRENSKKAPPATLSTSGPPKPSGPVSALCDIFERVLNEVYDSRSVSVEVVKDISTLYRQWSDTAPLLSSINSLGSSPTLSSYAETAKKVGSAHLIGSYHWSIILLTRPFLISYISWRQQTRKVENQNGEPTPEESYPSEIAAYAEACVDSAVKGLQVVEDLLSRPGLPIRLPWITNSVFNSAVAVGAAAFGDLDRIYSVNQFLTLARRVLLRMSASEPQAQRYVHIVEYLNDAVMDYLYHRDTSTLQHRQQKKNEMFGVVETDRPQLQSREASRLQQLNGQVSAQPASQSLDAWSPAKSLSAKNHSISPRSEGITIYGHPLPSSNGMISPSEFWNQFNSMPPLQPAQTSLADANPMADRTETWSTSLDWPVPDLIFEHYVPNGHIPPSFSYSGG